MTIEEMRAKVAINQAKPTQTGTTFLINPPIDPSNINRLQPNTRRNCRRWTVLKTRLVGDFSDSVCFDGSELKPCGVNEDFSTLMSV
jgi:hypothetical protein